MHLDARVARIARRQYGLITYEQAIVNGCSPGHIRARLSSGAWTEVRRGVYAIAGAPPSWEQQLAAVTLPFVDCWISHATAGRVWDLRHAASVDGIEVVRPYGRHRRVLGVIEHRSRIITPADVTRRKRLPVTAIGRTIVECSGRLDVKQTGQMLDDAKRRFPTALEDTRAAFARVAIGGRRRLRSIRTALALRLPGYDPGESDAELFVLRTLLRAGLPMPVQQHRVSINGRRYRIDLAYPQWKIAIELQSWTWHGGREAFDDDTARTADLVADGWRVLEVTTRHGEQDIVRWVSGVLMHGAA